MTDNGPKRNVRTHGVAGYRAGCKCAVCRLAESERKRNLRALGSGAKANVTPIRSHANRGAKTSPVIGDNEQSVRQQCEAAPKAADAPGTVQQAITLAKILDRPELVAMHPTTSRQLHILLLSLTPPPGKSKGKLLAIKKLQNRIPRGANDEAAHGD
jgi:hypothetical protein